jgi:phage terminase large subunit-like protein
MRVFSNPVDTYAQDVVDGRIPAGKYHRLSCARHLADRKREQSTGFPFRFDWEQADRFLRFARKLKHYKGKKWAGRYFEPTPCQIFRLGSIFGWRHVPTGRRRFTTAYNELPRKSGKTFEAAVVALYVTFFEGEPGAEGYCIATKREQARRVFDDAKRLVKSSGLKTRIAVSASNLHRDDTSCKLEPLGADADSTDGLNPYLIVTDEFHAHKNRKLVDVMESATGARQNPLHFQITTAGDDPVSPCGDQHDYVCKILDGVIEDDATHAFFGFIAHADLEDDWQLEATWRKAIPHYGISVEPSEVRKLALKAKNMPSAAAEFKQKILNLWVNTFAPCLSIDGWRQGQTTWDAADMKHQSCYVGIDLASKIDLCALSLVFPPTAERETWRVLQHIWTPRDTLRERAHRDRAPYDLWADKGWLTTTPGTRVDHQLIRAVLIAARKTYDIERIGFDPWHADTLVDQLIQEDGFSKEQVLGVPQTYQGMSSACLRMQAEILDAKVDARGCPVTAWAVSNAVPNIDGKDNLMFAKGRSRGRIDPVIAMTIAAALYLKFQPVQRPKRKPARLWTPEGFVSALPKDANAIA